MNYALNDGSANPYVSQWVRVKLNYLLVSDKFTSWDATNSPQGANYVWAGSVEFTPNKTGDYGLWGPGSIFSGTVDDSLACGYLSLATSTSTAKFDTRCPDPTTKNIIVPHYYIMGFQYSPSTATLGAKAQIPNYFIKTTQDVAWGSSDATGWGPIVKIDTFGGALKKLKVAFVLTVIREFATYPNAIQSFSYSGVYMAIDISNIWRPIVFGDSNQYNRERYNMAKLSYGIYGLASFKLSPATTCVAIDLDVEIKDINTAIFRTDNTDSLTDVVIAGDFFSGSNLNVCGSGVGTTPSRTMNQITTKIYKTIPDFSFDGQDIQFTSNNPTTFKLKGTSLNSGSSTISYNITLNYEGFISGSTYKISLSLT